nr:hypothetical protein [Dinophyceae sp. MRD-151]
MAHLFIATSSLTMDVSLLFQILRIGTLFSILVNGRGRRRFYTNRIGGIATTRIERFQIGEIKSFYSLV